MLFIIRVLNVKTGQYRYLMPNGSGSPERKDAGIFVTRTLADQMALEVQKLVGREGFTEIQEV